ncbi:cytochrome c-type biogenesis protein CcmH [Paraneptunicella aestuarii]|uniref:cytochrome c-type biogenesis protein n=1 Tax=Paraneptunicella aestuarii TaxID=2831148 RepID=UPI001E3972AD|nr:cytochrome c-type biogenesis protein [Paraneptunicella aestuarii]UAA38130.1 cytochrome c-type biogenesis protein CcmH [Paraneptunicella aestuarii]
MHWFRLVFLWSFVALSFSVWATTDTQFQFEDPGKQKLFLELKAELRCPMCQNQNIGDSNAMIALDLKRKVFELVEQGKSKQEIIDYMKARYGDFVHYQPPVTPITIWLWLLPLLFVLIAAALVVRSRMNATDADSVASNNDVSGQDGVDQDESKADELLDKYK